MRRAGKTMTKKGGGGGGGGGGGRSKRSKLRREKLLPNPTSPTLWMYKAEGRHEGEAVLPFVLTLLDLAGEGP